MCRFDIVLVRVRVRVHVHLGSIVSIYPFLIVSYRIFSSLFTCRSDLSPMYSIDAQNKANTTTSYMTSSINIPIFIIIKILMSIIHYDTATIRGLRSIHLHYYRHVRLLSLWSNN